MPSLFVLPSQLALSTGVTALAGATLTFSQTLTSTPQNVYSGTDLATPLANPLSADASGVFVPIYLDPSLPNYRVILKTSAGVVLKTWDDVPSNQNTAQQFRLKAIAPSLTFEETDASANNKIWRLKVNGEQLLLSILNDAEAVETTVFTFDRTGTTVDGFNFAGQYLKVNGILVATQESGSLTVTLSGMTATTTGTINWRRAGTKVSFTAPSAITGTSIATTMSMAGLGAFVPLGATGYLPTIIKDNGADSIGTATMNVGGNSIIFGKGIPAGNFTAAGTKGIPANWQFFFDTDTSGIA